GIMSDSVENLQTLAAWHTAAGIYADPYSLTEIATALGTTDVSNISSSQLFQPELDNFMAFRALAASLRPSADNPAVNWPAATPVQVAELQRIAEANAGRSSSMAKGVLCFFFDICYEEDEGETRGHLVETFHGTSLQDGTDGGLLVYPNPTDGTVTVEAIGDVLMEKILVYDSFGRIVFTKEINDYLCTLDLRHLDGGLYFIQALKADGDMTSAKVMKN
ncbi:MAG: T9SS type A sorting domain-containing protein, partial [Bacteroidales bacterium]|nr:T9SS type A sorting domain-containing protein [Bacteroidales bacterium]